MFQRRGSSGQLPHSSRYLATTVNMGGSTLRERLVPTSRAIAPSPSGRRTWETSKKRKAFHWERVSTSISGYASGRMTCRRQCHITIEPLLGCCWQFRGRCCLPKMAMGGRLACHGLRCTQSNRRARLGSRRVELHVSQAGCELPSRKHRTVPGQLSCPHYPRPSAHYDGF